MAFFFFLVRVNACGDKLLLFSSVENFKRTCPSSRFEVILSPSDTETSIFFACEAQSRDAHSGWIKHSDAPNFWSHVIFSKSCEVTNYGFWVWPTSHLAK